MLRLSRVPFFLGIFALIFATTCSVGTSAEISDLVEEPVPIAPPPYRIVLVSPEEVGAGSVLPDGMVLPYRLGAGRLHSSSSAWKAILGMVEDKTVRAVVIIEAPPGTAALFAELKEARPDLKLLAVSPAETPLVIQSTADFVIDFDHSLRAYTAMLISARMGHTVILSVSAPGASEDWRTNARLAVLRMASKDLSLSYKSLAGSPGGLKKDILEYAGTPGLTLIVNDSRFASEAFSLAEEYEALFIELDRHEGPSTLAATIESQPATLPGSDPVRTLIEAARNVPGRPGFTLVWPGEQLPLLERGVLTFTKAILDGKPANELSLARAMNAIWPTGQWHASYYVDPQSGVRARNHLLTGSDPYLVGRSYLSSEAGRLPYKYRQVSW